MKLFIIYFKVRWADGIYLFHKKPAQAKHNSIHLFPPSSLKNKIKYLSLLNKLPNYYFKGEIRRKWIGRSPIYIF